MRWKAVEKLLGVALLSLAPLAAAWAAAEALAPGIQHFEGGRWEEARKFFESYAAKNPKDADAAFYLGRTLLRLDRMEPAVEWLEKAAALAPNNSEKQWWLGRGYGASARQANILSKAGLAKKAKAAFDKAVALDPANLDARSDLVSFYLEAPGFMGGSVAKAKEQAAEIRKRDRLRGRQAMAGIYLYEKNPAGAEKELRQAVQEMPGDPRARFSLGLLYADAQRWNEAFESFEAILKADPQHYGALYQVGKTGALSGQRLDRAEECLKRYLSHNPGTDDPPLAYAHYRLGMVYEKKGNKAQARAEYQQAVKLDPNLDEAKKALAKVK